MKALDAIRDSGERCLLYVCCMELIVCLYTYSIYGFLYTSLRYSSAGDKLQSQRVHWTQLQELALGAAQLPLSDQEQPQRAH